MYHHSGSCTPSGGSVTSARSSPRASSSWPDRRSTSASPTRPACPPGIALEGRPVGGGRVVQPVLPIVHGTHEERGKIGDVVGRRSLEHGTQGAQRLGVIELKRAHPAQVQEHLVAAGLQGRGPAQPCRGVAEPGSTTVADSPEDETVAPAP